MWGREKEFQFLSHVTSKHCLIHLLYYTHASERARFRVGHEETCHRKRDAKMWLDEEVGILSDTHLVSLHTFALLLVRSGSAKPWDPISRTRFLIRDTYLYW